jgi:hypothetical protein
MTDPAAPQSNWWPFPPPVPGIYNIKRNYRNSIHRLDAYWPAVTVSLVNTGKAEIIMRVQFPGESSNRVIGFIYKSAWSDYEFQFIGTETWIPKIHADSDIVLPIAHSIDEAIYIVRQQPELWPQLNGVHVEYVEQANRPPSSAPATDDAP